MNERLDKLCFLPPPADMPWSGPTLKTTNREIPRGERPTVTIDVPLFWYDPPWYLLAAETADVLAVAVGRLGVCVSALRSDLSGPDQQSAFHAPQLAEEDEDASGESSLPPLDRIVPYRPERYGLSDRDFDDATIIDVRLMMNRDPSGRFAFAPEQIERWESTPSSEPLAGGGWVAAATFPPDVVSMEHLASKLNQLRALSPTAAVLVTIGPYRLRDELAAAIAAGPDGLILRLDEMNLDGLQLAMFTQQTRKLMDLAGATDLPLWVVPGAVTPDDAVKLVALGASAVAIDNWCADVVDEAQKQYQQLSAQRGYSSRSHSDDAFLMEMIDDEVASRVERFNGLLNSVESLPPTERLCSLHSRWAQTLGVRAIALPSIPPT